MNTFQALQQLSDQLALGLDITTYESLSLRSSGSCRIAVMGLVSRGKSTLVNQLIGLDLLPVSHRGETAADVHIESGPESTRLLFEDGTIDERLLSPEKFSQAIMRSSTPRVLEARISIPCRLPAGVVLVDTPGIDDAVSQTEGFDYLNNHWKRSGASGAIVIVSVPPGLGQSDRHLIATAKELFGNALAVIVKPTDSSVTKSDLSEVATLVQRHIDVVPVVISEIGNVGHWGDGSLTPVEEAISRLITRSEQSRLNASMHIEDIHSTIKTAIRSLSLSNLDRLKVIVRLRHLLPRDLVLTINERIAILEIEYEKHEEQRRQNESAAHLALMDAQAAEFIKVLRGVKPHSQPKKVLNDSLQELIPIARAGNQSAREVVQTWCRALTVTDRRRLGLELLAIRRSEELEFAVDVLEQATLEADEIKYLLQQGSLELLSSTRTRKLLSRSIQQLNVDELAALVVLTQNVVGGINQDCRERFISTLQQEISGTIRRVESDYSNSGLANLRQIHSSYISRLNSLQSQLQRSDLGTDLLSLREKFEQEVIVIAIRKANAFVDNLLLKPSYTDASPAIDKEIISLRSHADWLHSLRPSSETEGLVRTCGDDGALMRVSRAVEHATNRAGTVNTASNVFYIWSYIAWGVSFFFLFENPGAAVILWLVSFVVWLSTRSKWDEPKTWKDYYRPPSSDEASAPYLSTKNKQSSLHLNPISGVGATLKKIPRIGNRSKFVLAGAAVVLTGLFLKLAVLQDGEAVQLPPKITPFLPPLESVAPATTRPTTTSQPLPTSTVPTTTSVGTTVTALTLAEPTIDLLDSLLPTRVDLPANWDTSQVETGIVELIPKEGYWVGLCGGMNLAGRLVEAGYLMAVGTWGFRVPEAQGSHLILAFASEGDASDFMDATKDQATLCPVTYEVRDQEIQGLALTEPVNWSVNESITVQEDGSTGEIDSFLFTQNFEFSVTPYDVTYSFVETAYSLYERIGRFVMRSSISGRCCYSHPFRLVEFPIATSNDAIVIAEVFRAVVVPRLASASLI